MARGGSRQGKPGVAYPNRSDLNAGPRLAAAAPTGQPYGAAGAQLSAQAAVPMAPPGMAAPMSPSPPLSAPTARPSEPVTSGSSLGAGPGPESIPALNPSTIDPDIASFAPYIGSLELMASLPNASMATRNLIRRLRSSIPPDMPTSPTPEPPT